MYLISMIYYDPFIIFNMAELLEPGVSKVKMVPFILTENRDHNIAVPLSHLLDMIIN